MPPVTSVAPRRSRPSASARALSTMRLRVVAEPGRRASASATALAAITCGSGTAEHHRAAAVDCSASVVVAQHHAAARAAQRLVRGGGDDLGVRHRVEVAGEDLARDQAGEVRHVDHERGADLVGDLPHDPEVHQPRVGGVAGHDDQRPELAGGGAQRVVVEQAGRRVGAVAALVEHLAGDVRAEAVGEVAARVQGHAEHPLVAELAAQRRPVGLAEVVDLPDTRLGERGALDALRRARPRRRPGWRRCPECGCT